MGLRSLDCSGRDPLLEQDSIADRRSLTIVVDVSMSVLYDIDVVVFLVYVVMFLL